MITVLISKCIISYKNSILKKEKKMNTCFTTYKQQLEEQKIQFDKAIQNRNVFLLDMSFDSILFLLSQMYPCQLPLNTKFKGLYLSSSTNNI